ncbi:hypothetical protein [Nostoc commune]|uniref:hypothetical protein n=1 Tax=Nostoc commune TaxID=1178 RepID=UPI002072FE48|nr:hypothetical protein [Nostoc commune]
MEAIAILLVCNRPFSNRPLRRYCRSDSQQRNHIFCTASNPIHPVLSRSCVPALVIAPDEADQMPVSVEFGTERKPVNLTVVHTKSSAGFF